MKVNHFGPGAANGSFSICVIATIPDCVATPTAPANASIVCESATGTVLSWPAVPSATAYEVYINNVLVSANQTGTSYTTPAALGEGEGDPRRQLSRTPHGRASDVGGRREIVDASLDIGAAPVAAFSQGMPSLWPSVRARPAGHPALYS